MARKRTRSPYTLAAVSVLNPQKMAHSWRHVLLWCHREVTSTLPVIIMILGCCTQGLLSDCPRLCECKWKSGKESVICLNANLSSVPLELDAGTQVLDLEGNNLITVKNDEFSTAGLLNLQKVYIAKCRLKTLDRFAFRHLINLVELDLSYNVLPTVPSHVLDSIPELRELKLSGNPIQRIMNNAFVHVPQLVRLELSECKIGTIEARGFAGLENSLEWLKLDRNRLVDVRSTTLTSLHSLHGLELAGNPWNCSCSLRPLREWMLRQNVPFEIPPVCKYPRRLTSKPWNRLDLDEFACVPEILAPDPKAHGVEGRNITMTCRIAGVPEPSVRWLLKNRVIANLTGVPYNNGKKLYVVRVQNNSSNLTILTADVQDAGVYVCAAENKAGRVEASVTLAVSRKPPENSLNNKAVLAGVIVAALFVLASCLVALCVCSVRRRQHANRWQTRRTNSGRRHEDSYEKIEMNHKMIGDNGGNGIGPPGVGGDVAVVGPIRRNGEYRGVPCLDTDQELDEDEDVGYEDNTETPTPTNTNNSRESKLWTAAAAARSISSPNSGHWNSNLCEGSLDPEDLHIPRRTKEETR